MADENNSGSKKMQLVVTTATDFAKSKGHSFVTTEHLLIAIMCDEDVQRVSIRASENESVIQDITNKINDYLNNSNDIPVVMDVKDAITPTDDFMSAIDRANARMVAMGGDPTMVDALMSIIQNGETVAATVLLNEQLTNENIKNAAMHFGIEGFGLSDKQPDDEEHIALLREYCINLNEKAGSGKIDPLIGREEEVKQIVETLARRNKNNVVIVGPPGCGKTQIVEGLAIKIADGTVPQVLADGQVWSLDIGLLMAGTKYRGDVEKRVTGILKALSMIKNPILFIDEIHMVMGAGKSSEGGPDVGNLLKPALARGELKVIGSTTIEEFKSSFEKDKALMRRFFKLVADEPDVEDTIKILKGSKKGYEQFHRVTYSAEAIRAAATLASRYLPTLVNPDKSFDVIDKAGARAKLSNTDPDRKMKVGVREIEEMVSEMARVPAASIREDEISKLSHLRENIEKIVFDQEVAVDTLVRSVIRSRSGLTPHDKTLGSFLFVGNSGSGKTEMCKALASTMDIHLVKLDMSEYAHAHDVSKLIGAPPGYVGFDDPKIGDGKLINEVETNPYCLLLLDEIEKAHPSIFNILLQIMDDGKLTSSSGKTVSFRNVFLIMTSNAGASRASRNTLGYTPHGEEEFDMEAMTQAVEKAFTPEFRNRLDSVVKFKPLSRDTMTLIVDKFIGQLNKLSSEKKVEVVIDQETREWLAEKGYDPKLGARPMTRVIGEFIKDPLAEMMVFGNLRKGGIADITVSDDKTKLNVTVRQAV